MMNDINGFSLYQLLLIDIETVPNVPTFTQLSTEWQQLWVAKISKIMPENESFEEFYHARAGIMAEFGKVICISLGYFHENEQKENCLRIKTIAAHNETELLKLFVDALYKFEQHNKNFVFTGHNIREFDIPFLCRRMIINNLPLPKCLNLHGVKPWEVNMVDTLQWWKFGDYKNYISLNLLATVLNVPSSKTEMNGSMVQDVYYKENNLQRIVDYCQKDVEVVANLMLRCRNQSLLKDENIFIAE